MEPASVADCNHQVVAIDGPVASGKTVVGRALATRLGWRLFDTGIMYRAATWQAQQHRVHLDEEETVTDLIKESNFRLVPSAESDAPDLDVYVDNVNATPHLRESAVESGVPTVAAIAGVRLLMVQIQQDQATDGCMIVVGRDIGTVVLPDAPVKIFLDASEEVRARRRAAEQNGGTDEASVLKATQRRDARDRSRETSPLIASPDAITLDTSNLTLEQAIDAAEAIIRERIPTLAQVPDIASARQG